MAEWPSPRDVPPALASQVDQLSNAELEALVVWGGRLLEFRAAAATHASSSRRSFSTVEAHSPWTDEDAREEEDEESPEERANRTQDKKELLPWAPCVDPEDTETAHLSIRTHQPVQLDGPIAFLLVALRRDPFTDKLIAHKVLDFAYWYAPAVQALSTFHGGESSTTYVEAVTSILSKLSELGTSVIPAGLCFETRIAEFGVSNLFDGWQLLNENPGVHHLAGFCLARLTTFHGIFKITCRCYNIDGAAYPGYSIPQDGGIDFWCTAQNTHNAGGILHFEARVWIAVVRDDNAWQAVSKKNAFYTIAGHGQVDCKVVWMPSDRVELHGFPLSLRDFRKDREDDFDWYGHVLHSGSEPIVLSPQQAGIEHLHLVVRRYTDGTGLDQQDWEPIPPLHDEIDSFFETTEQA